MPLFTAPQQTGSDTLATLMAPGSIFNQECTNYSVTRWKLSFSCRSLICEKIIHYINLKIIINRTVSRVKQLILSCLL